MKLHSISNVLTVCRQTGWLPNQKSPYYLSSYISLRSSLHRISSGSDVDLRTKLFDEFTRTQVLTNLYALVLDPSRDEIDPVLWDLEEKETKLFGPFSIMAPFEDRLDGILDYWKHQKKSDFEPNWKFFSKAVATVRGLVQKGTLHPLTTKEAFRRLPKSTNWGAPYNAKGSIAGIQYLIDVDKALASNNMQAIFEQPCHLGWRGQPSGDPVPKQRVVWMFPHSVSIVEKCFCDPLVKTLTKYPSFHSWLGLDYVDRNITTMINDIKNSDSLDLKLLLSIDFSGFDKRLHHLFIDQAFNIIRYWFDERDASLISHIQRYFENCSLITPVGNLVGVHGVPSGSGLTNLVDSILNLIAYHYLLLRGKFKGLGVMIQGDDGLYSISNLRSNNYARVLDFISRTLNELCLVLNTEKQFYTFYDSNTRTGVINDKTYTDTNIACHFLQRLHSDFRVSEDGLYHGIRSIVRALNGMLSHETLKRGWNSFMESIRFLMQLENCCFHPLVQQFVEFLVPGDKYGLGRYVGGTSTLFANAGTSDEVIDKLGIRGFLYNQHAIDPTKPHEINISVAKYIDVRVVNSFR